MPGAMAETIRTTKYLGHPGSIRKGPPRAGLSRCPGEACRGRSAPRLAHHNYRNGYVASRCKSREHLVNRWKKQLRQIVLLAVATASAFAVAAVAALVPIT